MRHCPRSSRVSPSDRSTFSSNSKPPIPSTGRQSDPTQDNASYDPTKTRLMEKKQQQWREENGEFTSVSRTSSKRSALSLADKAPNWNPFGRPGAGAPPANELPARSTVSLNLLRLTHPPSDSSSSSGAGDQHRHTLSASGQRTRHSHCQRSDARACSHANESSIRRRSFRRRRQISQRTRTTAMAGRSTEANRREQTLESHSARDRTSRRFPARFSSTSDARSCSTAPAPAKGVHARLNQTASEQQWTRDQQIQPA